jgi:hypothetical protein
MNTVELTQFALGSAFDILGQVCADLTQEQADWIPPGVANPIGALYWHTISGADEVVNRWLLGQEPLHQREGWRQRVVSEPVAEPSGGEGWLDYLRALRADVTAMGDYAKAVEADIRTWLSSLAPEDLDRPLRTPIGEYTIAQTLEVFVIWHINAHCGEISALKGCLGARGYPF